MCKPGLLQQGGHGGHRVFVRTFGVDAFAVFKVPDAPLPTHRQVGLCLQVHLDARLGCIEQRHMPPLAHIKISAQQPVDMAQQILVEGCGHTQRIVVSGFQRGRVFHQIDSQQQAAGLALRRVRHAL